MSIEIRNVSRRFGGFVALDDVTVSIPTGQLTALLGPSGGGKSTLLRIIAGLDDADTGTIEIEGDDATGVPAQKRNVGFVFQHYAAFKHLSVFRNVAFGLEIRKVPKDQIRERVTSLLQLVHLEQFADRLPSQLSGGQRQRMALARALAIEPKVLLLDEPFGALDAKVRKELRDWLRRLHDEVHVTTVFVTHDQEEALEVADEIVVINDGRIEQIGTPDELYDQPANDFVMNFLGPVTTFGGELVRPHDLHLSLDPGQTAVAGTIERLTRVGHEVRAEVRVGDGTRASCSSPAPKHAPWPWQRVSGSGCSEPPCPLREEIPSRPAAPTAIGATQPSSGPGPRKPIRARRLGMHPYPTTEGSRAPKVVRADLICCRTVTRREGAGRVHFIVSGLWLLHTTEPRPLDRGESAGSGHPPPGSGPLVSQDIRLPESIRNRPAWGRSVVPTYRRLGAVLRVTPGDRC
jgi:sulfate/thiosulfate transport system ATP-binding protein